MLKGQVKKVHIATEEQARTFSTLIGEAVILVPSPTITAVLILPEIIYVYSTRSASLAQLVRDPTVKKIVPCPIPSLFKYDWTNPQNVVVAGQIVKDMKHYTLKEYIDTLINIGATEEDEETRVSTVAQRIYQFINPT